MKDDKFNWCEILKEFRKLNTPKNVYDIESVPFEKNGAKWHTILSERSIGKTTQFLLMGLCAWKIDGTQTIYCRQNQTMIARKEILHLYDVIINNHYIETLTDGEYDNMYLHAGEWYLCKYGDDGKPAVMSECVCKCVSVDQSDIYKSVLNMPKADFFVYDEFISNKFVIPNEFVSLCDLLNTLFRKRKKPCIFLLANTINKHAQYFKELGIERDVMMLERGNDMFIKTALGTTVYVQIVDQIDREKAEINTLFYGFDNPKLASITGFDTWSVKNYQHIPTNIKTDLMLGNIYLQSGVTLIRLEVVNTDIMGICVFAHAATNTYDDSRIYTLDDIYDLKHIHGIGTGKVDKRIWSMYKANKFYYATNDIGQIIEDYYKMSKAS